MTPERIPQADPRAAYLAYHGEVDEAIAKVLEGGRYVLGPEVSGFEEDWSAWLVAAGQSGARRAVALAPVSVGVASGTDAVRLALLSLGVGSGDTVITVSHTAVATVAAIEACGAAPLLVDIEDSTMTMDPMRLDDAIRECRERGVRAKAVVPVHVYGHPANMVDIMKIAELHGLYVVEDCAQAHGSSLDGIPVGLWGDAAAFSFYPTKNLGALGDGGAVTSCRGQVAERVRALREYGWQERFVSAEPGMNSRLDELQAAVLRVKLGHLRECNQARRLWAAMYDQLLTSQAITRPVELKGAEHVYHQYVLKTRDRDALQASLSRRGVGTAVHYPVPIHLQPAYAGRIAVAGPLEVTERTSREVLSLPMFPELGEQRVKRVAAAVADSLRDVTRP